MYKFEVQTQNGIHIVETENIEEFSRDWLNNRFTDFAHAIKSGQKYTTALERNTISPYDMDTALAVNTHARAKDLISMMEHSSPDVISYIAGVSINDLTDLQLAAVKGEKSKMVKSDKGHAFAFKKGHAVSDKVLDHIHPSKELLQSMMMAEGSMHLKDVVTIDDHESEFIYVIDLRGQATCLTDLVQRNVEKDPVLIINGEYSGDDSRPYPTSLGLNISGNKAFTANIENLIKSKKLPHMPPVSDTRLVGFSNSESNPHSITRLMMLTQRDNKRCPTELWEQAENPLDNFTILHLANRSLMYAMGSTSDKCYIEQPNGEVISIKVGEKFSLAVDKASLDVVVKKEHELDLSNHRRIKEANNEQSHDSPAP